ncbi:hypothetical protein D3C77_432330 [compost metagenome]
MTGDQYPLYRPNHEGIQRVQRLGQIVMRPALIIKANPRLPHILHTVCASSFGEQITGAPYIQQGVVYKSIGRVVLLHLIRNQDALVIALLGLIQPEFPVLHQLKRQIVHIPRERIHRRHELLRNVGVPVHLLHLDYLRRIRIIIE